MTPLRRGETIGPFIVEKELSSGGMATVYQARLPAPRGHSIRHVAVKVAREGYDDFLRDEEEHLRHLHHPHIIHLIPIPAQTQKPWQKPYIRRTTAGEPPLWYMALEHLKGDSLADLLRFRKRLPASVAVEIACQVGMALEYLHKARGVAHLDVRPDNILFRHDPLNTNWRPEAVLCDFGIAWRNKKVPTDSYGDLPYVAPERRWGEPVAFTCDVYSLGVVLYEMLVGGRPYPQDEDVGMAAAPTVDVDPSVPPSKYSHCSPQIDMAVLRAIARRPEDRYPTVSAFLEELAPVELAVKSHLDRQKPDWRQFLKWGIGLLLISLLGIISYLAGLSSCEVFPPSSPHPIAVVTHVVTAVPSFTIEATSTAVPATPTPTPPHSLLPPTPIRTSTPKPTSTLIPTPGTAGADQVIAYNPGPGFQARYGTPEALLGAPDARGSSCCQGMVQLGQGGSVLLAFTDNAIVDGDGPDFQVYGESARDDYLLIEMSADGVHWYAYPKVSESPEGLDLATAGLERAVYVRLTDLQPATETGAEVDAIVALHSGPVLGNGLPALPDAVARTDLALREGPDKRMKEVGQTKSGEILTVLGRSQVSGWVKVEADGGASGWCPVTALELNVSLPGYTMVQAPPTPKPTTTPVPESAILYSEDFENGVADGWITYVGTWSVEKEKDGNHFWRGRGPNNYPQTWWNTDDPRWTDYAFESRIRFVQGSIFVCIRADNGGAFYNAYISSNDDWVSFADYDGKQYQTFGDAAYDISPNKWYEVRFEVKGDTLKLYIDNRLITQARRSSRKQGGIGYYMGGGDEMHIDDIRVWALEP